MNGAKVIQWALILSVWLYGAMGFYELFKHGSIHSVGQFVLTLGFVVYGTFAWLKV